MKKKKSLAKKTNKLGIIKDEIKGEVVINNKPLIQDKDFFVTECGISLTKETEQKLTEDTTTSYSMSYSRSIVRKLK